MFQSQGRKWRLGAGWAIAHPVFGKIEGAAGQWQRAAAVATSKQDVETSLIGGHNL